MALDFKVSHGLNENGILYVPYADVKKYLKQLPTAEFSDTNVGDIISRKAAIDGLSKLRPRMIDTYENDGDTFLKVRACDVNDMLEALPSTERKKGHWISLDDGRGRYNEFGYKCSECGEQSDYEENYCPNCGVEMIGDNNGGPD